MDGKRSKRGFFYQIRQAPQPAITWQFSPPSTALPLDLSRILPQRAVFEMLVFPQDPTSHEQVVTQVPINLSLLTIPRPTHELDIGIKPSLSQKPTRKVSSSAACPLGQASWPRTRSDPEDSYKLWQYSSFSAAISTTLSNQLKRRREKKEMKVQERAKKVRTELEVMEAVGGLDVSVASTPDRARAGLSGIDMKRYRKVQPAALALPTPPPFAPASEASEASDNYFPCLEMLVKEAPDPTLRLPPLEFRPPSPSGTPPLSPVSAASAHFTFVPKNSESDRQSAVEANLISVDPSLSGFTFSHRTRVPGQATSFIDESRRSFATRIECPVGMSNLSSQLFSDAESISSVKTNKIPVMKTDGSRGEHQVRQIGVHRELGARVGYSLALKTALPKWSNLMKRTGFSRARGHVSRCLETHYPKLYDYHRSLAECLALVNLYFLFGAFASFCLNTGGKVACLPHRDQHNLGPGLCGIIPFGEFDSSRSGWVVLWEAQLCVEVGPGDTFFFPSAVFTHSNTSIAGYDKRNSLAFWCGASLFLWQECGMKAFSELEPEDQKIRKSKTRADWREAWERFPIL